MIAPTVSDGKRPANTKTIMADIPIGVDNCRLLTESLEKSQ
jgi:hypothetical protein